jgi:hypothetical protein
MRKFYTRKKIKLALLCLCFFVSGLSVSATTYTFTGNGDWDIASNWAGNNIAPHTSGANDIIINGTLTTSAYSTIVISTGGALTVNGSLTTIDPWVFQNYGTITINSGGSLILQRINGIEIRVLNYNLITINAGGLFRNNGCDLIAIGHILVNGSFINSGLADADDNYTVTINGTMTNNGSFSIFNPSGSVSVNNGGVLNNSGDFTSGNITINSGGTINNNNTIYVGVLNNTGTIIGSGTIVNNFTNSGTIAPGNSPGLITISGNYTGTSTATHNIEISGTSAAQYDRINSSANVVVGGTLNASLINGFVPSGIHNLVIISGNTVTGTFSTVNIPSGYLLRYNPTNITLEFGSVCSAPAIPTVNLIQPTCDTLTGTITVTAPTSMTSYTVTGTSPVTAPVTQSGLVFAGLAQGTYNVTTTNAGGCTSAPLSVVLKLDKADWTGAIDDNWHNPSNWNTGQVPTATTHVYILTGTPPCRIRDADAHVASIQIQSGGILEILNGWQIVIHGNCVTLPPH